MPYIAPIIAYVDNLGYLRCIECVEENQKHIEMYADNAAIYGEICDCCGKLIVEKLPQ